MLTQEMVFTLIWSQMIFAGYDFHLKLVFKTIVLSHEIVLTLNLNSRKISGLSSNRIEIVAERHICL